MARIDLSFRPDAATIPPREAVEVAEIVYLDAMKDASPAGSPGVAIVWARREAGMIRYRLEVDGGCESLERKPCPLPLTLAELVGFIDKSCDGVAFWNHLWEQGQGPADMPRFRVSSKAYPTLSRYFADRAAAWMQHGGEATQPSAERLATIRRGLLWRLDTADRQRGISRAEAERQAEIERCLALRFERSAVSQTLVP